MSSGHSNSAAYARETRNASPNRVRFCSAPSSTVALWPPQLPNSVWTRVDQGAKCIGEKTKSLIVSYAPAKWREPVLNRLDSLATYLQNAFDDEKRSRISDFWSSNVLGEDEPIWYRKSIAFSLSLFLITGILILILHAFLSRLALGLALPFYGVWKFINWWMVWRRGDVGSPSLKMLNRWWCAAALVDFSILLISSLSESCMWDQFFWYCLPVMAVGVAQFYFGDYNWHAWLIEYFLLTYGVRVFSDQAFIIFPDKLRVFAGYFACYVAVKAASKSSLKQNGVNVCSVAFSAGACESSPSDDDGAVASFKRPATVPQLVLPSSVESAGGSGSYRNRFHLSDSDSALRAMAGRGSRRISLPAGSLLPMKAAQSNLSEARGMLADMLAQKELPPHLVSGLKAVSSLLAYGPNQSAHPSQFDFLGSLPRVLDSPYIGGDVSLASVETAAQRRQSPSVAWSTTTSATGLPTLEPEPSRARSSSYWKHKQFIEGENENARALMKQSIELPSKLLQLPDGTIYDLEEIIRDPYLDGIKEWSLPIFDLYTNSPDTLLSRVAYAIFQKSGLFRIFKINKQKFMSFFHAVEEGYWNIPYHNRIHAADVLHATYYFTSLRAPAFADSIKTSQALDSIGEQCEDESRDSDQENESDTQSPCGSPRRLTSQVDDPSGTLASVLSSLELMGLYTAAAMHDFDHPGRTNAFLVAIQDKKAILYNDRSVLENHHAASAWQLLTTPENNFIEQLDAAEFKRFRYTIIETILATDLKRHFEILMDFNGKVAKGLDWDNENDKFLTCQICMKMADINSPAKPSALHREWTNRILEEFYAQGDEEKERGLPVSPYMDRHDSQLARLQDSFIAHLVAPLAQAMNEAGLLPLTAADPSSGELMKSELLVNLENNHKHWKIELGEDPDSVVQAGSNLSTLKAGALRGSSPGSKSEEEMDTIEEQDDETGNFDGSPGPD